MDEPLRILFIAPEVAPFVRTGGFGDVTAALPTWTFPLTDLPPVLFQPVGIECRGFVNFMKAGLLYADILITVSLTSRSVELSRQSIARKQR